MKHETDVLFFHYATDLKSKTTVWTSGLSLVRDNKEARASLPPCLFGLGTPDVETLRADPAETLSDRLGKIPQTRAAKKNGERLFKPTVHWRKLPRVSPETSESKNEYPRAFEKREKWKNKKLENGFKKEPSIEGLPGISTGRPETIRPRPEKPVQAKCRQHPVKTKPCKTVEPIKEETEWKPPEKKTRNRTRDCRHPGKSRRSESAKATEKSGRETGPETKTLDCKERSGF